MQEDPNHKLPISATDNAIAVWGGMECTINRVEDFFYDQLAYAGFYNNAPLESLFNLGVEKIRFPILWEKHQPSCEKEIDWSWTDRQLRKLAENKIEPIAGLLHHGSGPAFTNLLDPHFPNLFANYAKQVATQFPDITYYTPINEPLTTARFSGLYGLWYPHHKNDHSFLMMLLHQLKGVVLAMREIKKINPNAKLIQTEDLGKTYSTPKLAYQANFENKRRWLTYDTLCGKVNEQHKLWKYLIKKNKIPQELLHFFLENPLVPDVFGFNYYVTSERYLDEDFTKYAPTTHGGNKRHKYADVEAVRVPIPEDTGIKVLLSEAWQKYYKPIAVTEVHLHCHREEQLRWFKYVWDNCIQLKNKGVDIKAITSWALFGSFGWDKLLTKPRGNYEPGAFDIRSGTPRPTALATYIKEKTNTPSHIHSLANDTGWWGRDIRFLHSEIQYAQNLLNQKNFPKSPILILGKTGTLGKAFARICTLRAIPFILLGREECNITQPESIRAAIWEYRPWAIINAAGYVKVDEAESQVQQCFEANEHGSIYLASECVGKEIKLVTFSTDLVFDGNKNTPYVESDGTNPLNVYGASKAFAEKALKEIGSSILIIRTSAFFSAWDKFNFLYWVENNLRKGVQVPVAENVFISPTFVPDLVHATLDLLIDDESGIWHIANAGCTTWANLAFAIAKEYGLDSMLIQPKNIQEMNLPADRPLYSVLGTEKGGLLPTLQSALRRYFDEKHSHIISRRQAQLV